MFVCLFCLDYANFKVARDYTTHLNECSWMIARFNILSNVLNLHDILPNKILLRWYAYNQSKYWPFPLKKSDSCAVIDAWNTPITSSSNPSISMALFMFQFNNSAISKCSPTRTNLPPSASTVSMTFIRNFNMKQLIPMGKYAACQKYPFINIWWEPTRRYQTSWSILDFPRISDFLLSSGTYEHFLENMLNKNFFVSIGFWMNIKFTEAPEFRNTNWNIEIRKFT